MDGAHRQELLREILSSDTQTIERTPGGQLKIFDANTGRGVLFEKDGSMKGFL